MSSEFQRPIKRVSVRPRVVVPFEIAQKVFQKGVRCQDIEFADPCTAALLGPYGVQGHGTAGAGCRAEEVPSLMSEHINGGVLVMESCDQAFEYKFSYVDLRCHHDCRDCVLSF